MSEYTNDPKKYVPLEEKEPEDTDKEIVPWNIACVAGNVKENQYRGEGVKVAVIDSGIDTHYELATKDWMDFSDKTDGQHRTWYRSSRCDRSQDQRNRYGRDCQQGSVVLSKGTG